MKIGRRATIAAGLLWTPALAGTESGELRVSYLEGFGFLPNLVARQRGLIEKHAAALGLPRVTVTWQSLRSAVIATDALLAGQLDVICGTITSLLVLWDKTNGGAKVLAGLGGQLVTLVTRNPAVITVGDFGPADRIAVPSVKQGPHSILLGIALEKQLGPDARNKLDSIQVQMGHNDGALAVLTPSSPVNSHFSTLPYMDMELASKIPIVHKVVDLLDIVGGPITTLAAYATTKFAAENPIKARAFLMAIDEANILIAEDKLGVSRDYLAATGEKFEAAALAEMIGRKGNLYATAPLRANVYAAQMAKTGLIRKAPADWREYHFPLLHDRQGS
jgi:NitT/TauT family transport system substrate-binding protein